MWVTHTGGGQFRIGWRRQWRVRLLLSRWRHVLQPGQSVGNTSSIHSIPRTRRDGSRPITSAERTTTTFLRQSTTHMTYVSAPRARYESTVARINHKKRRSNIRNHDDHDDRPSHVNRDDTVTIESLLRRRQSGLRPRLPRSLVWAPRLLLMAAWLATACGEMPPSASLVEPQRRSRRCQSSRRNS